MALVPREKTLALYNADFCFSGWGEGFLELGGGHPKNEKFMTFYNLHARR